MCSDRNSLEPPQDPAGVHVRAIGAGERTVVLLHGYSDHGGTWRKVTPALAERYRVLVVDLPGFGRSAGAAWQEPLIDGYVDVLSDLVGRDRGRVSVIGNSLGAVTALAWASARPDLVSDVVLADMPGVGGVPRTWIGGTRIGLDRITRIVTGPVPERYVQQLLGSMYLGAALRHRRRADADLRSDYAQHYATRTQVAALLAIGRVVIREIADLPIPAMIEDLTVPTLLLWGANDLLTPARAARRITTTSERRVAVIPSCGHCPQLDCPSEFLAEVLPFLARSTARPPR